MAKLEPINYLAPRVSPESRAEFGPNTFERPCSQCRNHVLIADEQKEFIASQEGLRILCYPCWEKKEAKC